MYVFDKLFLSKASLQSTVFIQNLYFTNGPRLGCMGTGRFWQMWYPFISQVDFFYHFICIRSTLISFIIIFPLKSIPQQGSVVPPSAPQDYCGSNDTSRFSITGTIEWFKPFLVLAWASGAEYGLQCRPNSCRDDCITPLHPLSEGPGPMFSGQISFETLALPVRFFLSFLIHFFSRTLLSFFFSAISWSVFGLGESHKNRQDYISTQDQKNYKM